MEVLGVPFKIRMASRIVAIVAALAIQFVLPAAAQDAGFTLTKLVNPAGGGGIFADPAPGEGGLYAPGTVVHLTPIAAPGKLFQSWSGALTGNVYPAELVMNENKTVTANFVQVRFSLTRSVSPLGAGEIGLQPPPGTDGKYTVGTTVTATAFPAAGKVFAHWGGAASGNLNPVQILINENKSLTAYFETSSTTPRYTLARNVTPAGSGNISAVPLPGPDGKYAAGTTVTLTAHPAPGYAFDHWGESVSGSVNPIVIEMTANKFVLAAFVSTAPRFALTKAVNPIGGGEIGVQPLPGPDGKYPAGTVLTLRAFAAAGKVFAHWGGAVTGSSNPVSLTLNENKSVTAFFETSTVPRFALNRSVTPVGGGQIALQPMPGPDGKYAAGTTVTLTAIPATGKVFFNWGGAVSGTENPKRIVMDADKAVIANFETSVDNSVILTRLVAPLGFGEISVSPPPGEGGKYALGTVVTLIAHPAAGKLFHHWSGAASGTVNSVQVTMNENKTVTANFVNLEVARYTLLRRVSPAEAGAISAEPQPGLDGKYAAGTIVTLTAHPVDGRTFVSWSGAATGVTNPVQVTMNENKIVTANFSGVEGARYNVSTFVQPQGAGQVSLSPPPGEDGKYESGAVVTITATAADGYVFAHWGGMLGIANPLQIVVNGNKVIEALFEATSNSADLSVQVSPFPNPAVVGAPLTLTIMATNNGPASASGVVLEFEIPEGTTYVGAEAPRGTITGPTEGSLRCEIGALPPTAVAGMVVRVVPQSVGSIQGYALLESEQGDPNLDNNILDSSIEVVEATEVGPDVVGTAGPVKRRPLLNGDSRLNITFSVGNEGTSATVPFAIQFYLSSDGILDDSDALIANKNVFTIRPYGQRTKRFAARVPGNAQGKSIIAVIDAGQQVSETDESNNRVVFGPVP